MDPALFDLLIVGRGIVGLAHALAATRLGLRTAVLDRETHAVGASVRNSYASAVAGGRGNDYMPMLSDVIAELNGVSRGAEAKG